MAVLEATRTHLELYRTSMVERGAGSTAACRRRVASTASPTVIDGRIESNPAQYVRRPQVHPSELRGLDRGELGRFLFTAERFDHAHAALAVLLGLDGLRVSEACETNIEDMAFERGHQVMRIIGKGNKPALIPLVPRSARTIDLAVGERREGPILVRHDGGRLDRRAPTAGSARLANEQRSDWCTHICLEQRPSWPVTSLDAGVALRDVQVAARRADPRTTTVYDRRRQDFDKHAAYVVVFVAGG